MTPRRRFSPAEYEAFEAHNAGVRKARAEYAAHPTATGRPGGGTHHPCTHCQRPTESATSICRTCTKETRP